MKICKNAFLLVVKDLKVSEGKGLLLLGYYDHVLLQIRQVEVALRLFFNCRTWHLLLVYGRSLYRFAEAFFHA